MIRLCLDVNVWVSHYLTAALRPHTPGPATGLVVAALSGTCRLGPIQLIVSHTMLDTLECVMKRIPVTGASAMMARDEIEAATSRGFLAERPSIVFGGNASYPLADEEDADVLNTAVARRADLLVTSNLADFTRGPRARTDTEALATHGGSPDVFRLNHPKLADGLILTTPTQAAGWLLRGKLPSPGVSVDEGLRYIEGRLLRDR